MDKILLNQMAFYGYHGLFPEETKLGQRFLVDAELMLDLKTSSRSDDMNDSIDYGEVYNVIKEVVEGKPRNLVETIAEQIADELFRTFNLLEACRLKVTKPDPPIAGHYQSVAVEIFREKRDKV
ncbi:dihydroneopterin aldolase [Lentibacillus persicus]|uniref:7,8-dihydroneopterin aldolase n=1 Tax=Lentibacillus persicus TaxID=640948 RepID=A0A1I1V043_9BACI|nr:dihydroneopterin aldolase [Lentibacillus persicus]SFD73650.1 dihydroneopterin aldolase [Lentibacillus persicus]